MNADKTQPTNHPPTHLLKNAVIHRDLKPENLLLDSEKNIKIIDFGFGQTYKSDGLLDTFCGSPFYAAPEMILGKRYEGPEVDMWSLGVILFALLCGHLPFDDENMKELYRKISTATYSIPDHVPVDCKYLISRMITVDPKKRATLQEVKNHRWVCETFDGPPDNLLPARPLLGDEDLDKQVLQRLMAFGYKLDDILVAFSNHKSQTEAARDDPTKTVKINPCVSTYHLLSEMLQREAAKQALIDAKQRERERDDLAARNSKDEHSPSSPLSQDAKQQQQQRKTSVHTQTPGGSSSSTIEQQQQQTLSPASSASSSTPSRIVPSAVAAVAAPSVAITESNKDLYAIHEDDANGDGDGDGDSMDISDADVSRGERDQADAPTRQNRLSVVGKDTTTATTFTSMPAGLNNNKREAAPVLAAATVPSKISAKPEDRAKSASVSLVASSPASGGRAAAAAAGGAAAGSPRGLRNKPAPSHLRTVSASPGPITQHGPMTPVGTSSSTTSNNNNNQEDSASSDGHSRRLSMPSTIVNLLTRNKSTATTTNSTSPSTSPNAAHGSGAPAVAGSAGASNVSQSTPSSPSARATPFNRKSVSNAVPSSSNEIRSINGWFMNVSTTSNKQPMELLREMKRVLQSLDKSGLRFEMDTQSPWVVVCEVATELFQSTVKEQSSVISMMNLSAQQKDNAAANGGSTTTTTTNTTNNATEKAPVEIAARKMSPLRESMVPADSELGQLSQDLDELAMGGSGDEQDEDEDDNDNDDEHEQEARSPSQPRRAGFPSSKKMVTFQIEVCKVPRLNLHGLHFKRLSGGVWSYKKVCNRLLPLMSL